MFLRTKTSTILTAIAISLASTTPAFAHANIRDLSNGNYRFCVNPPVSDIATDTELFNAGHCYLFRKTGSRLTGVLFDPSTYGEVQICVTGNLNENTLTGEALQTFYFLDTPLSVEPRYRGSIPAPWDNNDFLKIANGIVVEHKQNETGIKTTIRYRTAELNLDNFHHYNAGQFLPPASCFD